MDEHEKQGAARCDRLLSADDLDALPNDPHRTGGDDSVAVHVDGAGALVALFHLVAWQLAANLADLATIVGHHAARLDRLDQLAERAK